jgi:hypothetical protein
MNVLYHTSFRNYASISLQVPSNISILLGPPPGPLLYCTQEQYLSLMNPPSERTKYSVFLSKLSKLSEEYLSPQKM